MVAYVCVSWSHRRTSAGGLRPPAPFASGRSGRTTTENSFGNSLSSNLEQVGGGGGPHWETPNSTPHG